MPILSIQYLEDSPEIQHITAQAARDRLHEAFQRLPINMLLLGWNLPEPLIAACADECDQAGVALYRWHPLLTGDGALMPQPAWQTIGVDGTPIAGFQNMPEFTFICPNRPAVQDAVFTHLETLLENRYFEGIFLDRMRYPSPADHPEKTFGCFCEACKAAASHQGLDLETAQHTIQKMLAGSDGARHFVQVVLGPDPGETGETDLDMLRAVIDFRMRSVSQFIEQCTARIRAYGCSIGLDGFSPVLTKAVGQNLNELDEHADWTKIMTYGHTFGPAGLPFELLALADWLVERHHMTDSEAMALLGAAAGFPLPDTRTDLRQHGLVSQALYQEARRAKESGVRILLAGVELVDIPGVAELHSAQIAADLRAFREASADGLALSWDLWMMPLERLDLVRTAWTI